MFASLFPSLGDLSRPTWRLPFWIKIMLCGRNCPSKIYTWNSRYAARAIVQFIRIRVVWTFLQRLCIAAFLPGLAKHKPDQFHVVTRSYIFTFVHPQNDKIFHDFTVSYGYFPTRTWDLESNHEEDKVTERRRRRGGDRFDSVTSQAKRTEEKRKSHASEGQKQHGSSSGSIERSDRSIPGITQTWARVIRERAGNARREPSAKRSESGEKSNPQVEKLLRDETDSSYLFFSFCEREGRRLHPPTRRVILHQTLETRRVESSELLIRDAKEERSVEWMSGKWNIRRNYIPIHEGGEIYRRGRRSRRFDSDGVN